MRIRSLVPMILILALALTLCGCGVIGLPAGVLGTQSAALDVIGGADGPTAFYITGKPAPESTAAPESAAAPETPVLPLPRGVDSVQTLLEISLDYFHNDCDYSRIAEYHDPAAYLACFIMEDFYRDEELSFAEARVKAALLYGDAATLEAGDPRLAELVAEEMDVEDADDLLNDFMSSLRDDFRSGEITEADPNYELFSAMLTDWDKGSDYLLTHYPALREQFRDQGICFDLEDAMDAMRRFARFELCRSEEENRRFRDLSCEYRPENVYVDESGVCSYDMGYVVNGNEAWGVDMLYYYEDGLYYLIGYSYVLGNTGG